MRAVASMSIPLLLAAFTSLQAREGSRPVVRGEAGLPQQLQGIWMSDDDEGRTKCQRYLALPDMAPDNDEIWSVLVGSLVVHARLLHEFAEYGEGNFYLIKSMRAEGTGTWSLEAAFGADVVPTADDVRGESRHPVDSYRLAMHGKRLTFSEWPARSSPGSRDGPYVRCGDLPPILRHDDHHATPDS